MVTTTDDATTQPGTGRWPLWLMRAVVTLVAALVFVQPMLAGQFLAGNFDTVGLHAAAASAIALLVMFQGLAAVLLWRPGRGPAWPVAASVVQFLLVGLQLGMGYSDRLAVHVPLGVAVVAIALLQLLWVWLPHSDGRNR